MISGKLPIITCPVCGQEYMFGEVYMPNSFFGKATEVVKNERGKIEFYIGEDPDLTEEYVCDGCGTKLNINASVTFNVEPVKEFDEEYVTPISKPKKINLQEEGLFD